MTTTLTLTSRAVRSPEERLLVLLAIALTASGLFHVAVWLGDGAPSLLGPVSWRKPIVFGLSTGVTTLSLAWIVSLLPATRGRHRWSVAYAVSMALEVILIDLQQWRGVPSHFNAGSTLDTVIFNAMGALILTSAAASVSFLVTLWRAPLVERDERAAGLGALLLLQGGVIIGLLMVGHGQLVAATHEGEAAVVAGRGLLKISHGISLHGLQILPLLMWVLARCQVDIDERVRWLHRTAIGLTLIVVGEFIGALAGRVPLDPPPAAAVLIAAGALVLLAVALRVAAAFHTILRGRRLRR